MQKSHFPWCSRWGTVIILQKVFGHVDSNDALFIWIWRHFQGVSGSFSKSPYISFRNKLLLLRLTETIVTIPDSVLNGYFFSPDRFFENTFFNFWLLWAVVRSLLGCSCRCSHDDQMFIHWVRQTLVHVYCWGNYVIAKNILFEKPAFYVFLMRCITDRVAKGLYQSTIWTLFNQRSTNWIISVKVAIFLYFMLKAVFV
jgi:hypothetical protein